MCHSSSRSHAPRTTTTTPPRRATRSQTSSTPKTPCTTKHARARPAALSSVVPPPPGSSARPASGRMSTKVGPAMEAASGPASVASPPGRLVVRPPLSSSTKRCLLQAARTHLLLEEPCRTSERSVMSIAAATRKTTTVIAATCLLNAWSTGRCRNDVACAARPCANRHLPKGLSCKPHDESSSRGAGEQTSSTSTWSGGPEHLPEEHRHGPARTLAIGD